MKQLSHQNVPNSSFIPDTLVDLLRSRAEQYPDSLAYRFIQDSETEIISILYKELDRRARAIGTWLEASGATGELLLYPPGLDNIASFTCNDYES
jgi:acyl-CoA synthetase (AMP-forming)/AMP-acid ligase II